MWFHTTHGNRGYTLTEVAVAMAIMSMLGLMMAALLVETTDTYGRLSLETYTTSQVRACLETIGDEVRESINFSIADPASAAPQTVAQDVLLLTSARRSDGRFVLNAGGYPESQSIVLYYMNTSPEGISQLVRHQLYYAEDLNAFAPPFILAPVPLVANNIVIVDNTGISITVERTSGAAGATASFGSPRSLINHVSSLDIVWGSMSPIEINVTCKFVGKKGRTATSRFTKQALARNI